MSDSPVVRIPRRKDDDILFIKPKRRVAKATTVQKERALEINVAGPSHQPSPSLNQQDLDKMSPLQKRQLEVMSKVRSQNPVVKKAVEKKQAKPVSPVVELELEPEPKAEDSEIFTIESPIDSAAVPTARMSSDSNESVAIDLPDSLGPGAQFEERGGKVSGTDESIMTSLPDKSTLTEYIQGQGRNVSDSEESIQVVITDDLVPGDQFEVRGRKLSDTNESIMNNLADKLNLEEQREERGRKIWDTGDFLPRERFEERRQKEDEPIRTSFPEDLVSGDQFEERGSKVSDSDECESIMSGINDDRIPGEQFQGRGWTMPLVFFIASLIVLLISHLFL